jgi:hypothetical protein
MSNTNLAKNTTQKTKRMSNTNLAKNTTQKTKRMSSTNLAKNTTQKTKRMSSTNLAKKRFGERRHPRRASSPYCLYDTHHVNKAFGCVYG